MNLFAHFISECGFNPKDYPRLSGITVIYTDRKNRPIEKDSELMFSEPVFCKNAQSFKNFQNFLKDSENNVLLNEIRIRIEDDAIVVNPNSPEVKIFLR